MRWVPNIYYLVIIIGCYMLFFSSVLFADELATKSQPSMIENLVPFVFVFIIMYFFLIKPQSKKAKEHTELIKQLKNGDEVVTSAGIIAKIKSIQGDVVLLETGASPLKVLKESVQRLYKPMPAQEDAARDKK